MTSAVDTTNPIESVCVVGLGYIGLPTAAFIASAGMKVVGVDVNESHVSKINAGKVPFHEPDFEALLRDTVTNGNLRAATCPTEADAYIIAVPTPFNDDYTVDTTYIQAAAKSIAPVLQPGALVVLESTCPPGTTEQMAQFLTDERPDLTTDPNRDDSLLVAHCPERVLPGRIMVEMASNDRVIGGLTAAGAKRAKQLYTAFCDGEILLTDATTAEMAKLTENSFRDVNIAFANELSLICDRLGIDVWELIDLANHHPRVNILQPGPGVGGHCIAVDPWFIVSSAPEETRLIKMARTVNDDKPNFVISKVLEATRALDSPTIAAFGLAFKRDIDDLRSSPSLEIVKRLADEFPDSHVLVVEPNVEELPPVLANRKNVTLVSVDEATDAADTAVLLVDHTPFASIDLERFGDVPIIDTRGIWK